jgi:Xaa-Pro aminopeptidase
MHRYTPAPKELYIRNRKRLNALLKPNSIVIIHANDVMPTNADGTMGFRQNTDLFYLSGIDQEETILVLFPDAPDKNLREILFLRETNETIAIWEGARLSKEEGYNQSGIKNIQWTSEFEASLQKMLPFAQHVYLHTNEHTRAVVEVQSRNARFIEFIKKAFPLHDYCRLAPLMHQLRAIKQPEEIVQLQEACRITELGFRKVLSVLKPGVNEFDLEAELLHTFIKNRSRGFAYPPIIASGKNACVLHYIENSAPCKAGDLVLIDVGAEYGNYNADMTRCIPVSGKFLPRQKDVYNAVLRVMRKASAMLVPDNTFELYNKAVGQMMEEELIGLGLLKAEDVAAQDPEKPLYKKYFMHGTSHYLGLDVHDLGSFYRPFEENMVFTCEPGIYIPEEGLGIRLENNFIVKEGAPIDLMANIPIEVEEIEALMNSNP